MTLSNSPIICILGPTNTGKTQLALSIAEQLPVEIISVDSALVYRGLDIGTAKPTAAELATVPHHLVNICDPAEHFSAGKFCELVPRLIQAINARDHIPLLVGGTMLYFNLLINGVSDLPPANAEIRAQIDAQALQMGWPALHAQLVNIDPLIAARIKPTDPVRIQRALELYYQTGKKPSELQQQKNISPLVKNAVQIALRPPIRSELRLSLAQRFDAMLAAGFIEEVSGLYNRGDLQADLPAIRTVGYRQAWDYVAGQSDYQTMRERAIIATAQLAKRQMTWLNAWRHPLSWFDSRDPQISAQVLQLLKSLIA